MFDEYDELDDFCCDFLFSQEDHIIGQTNKQDSNSNIPKHNKENSSNVGQQIMVTQNHVCKPKTFFVQPQQQQINYPRYVNIFYHDSYEHMKLMNITINPWRFRFLPQGQWENRQICLSNLLKSHFQSRSTKKVRFEHKLWNALQLTSAFPELYQIFGLFIVSPHLLKADRDKMGSSFALTKPNAALFNQQGAFPSHGFVEVSREDAIMKYHAHQFLVSDVDEMKVRLYAPKDINTTLVEHLQNCHWNSPNSSLNE